MRACLEHAQIVPILEARTLGNLIATIVVNIQVHVANLVLRTARRCHCRNFLDSNISIFINICRHGIGADSDNSLRYLLKPLCDWFENL